MNHLTVSWSVGQLQKSCDATSFHSSRTIDLKLVCIFTKKYLCALHVFMDNIAHSVVLQPIIAKYCPYLRIAHISRIIGLKLRLLVYI